MGICKRCMLPALKPTYKYRGDLYCPCCLLEKLEADKKIKVIKRNIYLDLEGNYISSDNYDAEDILEDYGSILWEIEREGK